MLKAIQILMMVVIELAIAVLIKVRTGCRGRTPGWGQRPHTPFNPNVLTHLRKAIEARYGFGITTPEAFAPIGYEPYRLFKPCAEASVKALLPRSTHGHQ